MEDEPAEATATRGDPIRSPRPFTEPDGAEEPLATLARSLLAAGEVADAVDALEQAIELSPHRVDLQVELGNLLQEWDEPEAALEWYRRAVVANPDFIPARQSLGYLLSNLGEPEQALEQYDHAVRVQPTPLSRLLVATVLPVIYDSASDVSAWRERFTTRVRHLAELGLRVATGRSQIPTHFFLAYQGGNDRELVSDLGRIYRGSDLRLPAGENRLQPRADGRLRIGFLSVHCWKPRKPIPTIRNSSSACHSSAFATNGRGPPAYRARENFSD